MITPDKKTKKKNIITAIAILAFMVFLFIFNFCSFSDRYNIMITPDKKTKKKNIITALAIIAFMIFLFFFTLYNTGVFDMAI